MTGRIPLLDALGFSQLERDLLAGDPRAASLLATGLDSAYSARIRASIHAALKKVTRAACIDTLWTQALRSRSMALLEILLHIKQPASAPAEVRAFSLLKLNRLHQLEDAAPDLVLPLIQACDDSDLQIAAAARQVIGHLRKDDALDILCVHWARTRGEFLGEVIRQAGYLAHNPLDVRVLTALKLNQPDQIDTTSVEIVGPLLQASRDADGGIAASADYLLRHALSGAALTEFCLRWSRTRDAFLEAILLESLLLPRQPPPLRLLCALKLGNLEIAQKCPPRNLDVLLTACSDADGTIRANARSALRNLHSSESREALCQRFLQDGTEEARMAAMDAGYQPAAREQHALFLFLTAQWNEYETLDFDRRLLRALYDTATLELRQRLARTVQSSGRIEYLSILTGQDDRQRAAGMEDSEAGLVVQMLAQAHNWERLWQLAQEFPLARSVEILRLLLSNAWAPSAPEERALFQRLAGVAALPLSLTSQDAAARLPPAVPLATLKIHGRVNDLSFAPDRPHLALACGNRKVVLWDYQKAKVASMLVGFDHSVGQVVCLPEGALACGERTNGTAQCAVILAENDRHVHLGYHAASVTALLPLPGGNLLSAGRDGKVILWNRATHVKIGEMITTEWPRCAAISSDGRLAALLGERLQLVELPSLQPLNGLPQFSSILPRIRSGVARCATFAREQRSAYRAGKRPGGALSGGHVPATPPKTRPVEP